MPIRKTKPVYLLRTESVVRVYENQDDLREDLRQCQEIVGNSVKYEESEILMVLASDEIPLTRVRRVPVRYSEEFERFWKICQPKKNKERVYAIWGELAEADRQLAWEDLESFADAMVSPAERLEGFRGKGIAHGSGRPISAV